MICQKISIHPPRAGRDVVCAFRLIAISHFNPPAPCGAGRSLSFAGLSSERFQSTRPVRGGTERNQRRRSTMSISIHPPRAGRDETALREGGKRNISIHPPRAGRDLHDFMEIKRAAYFNPPAPCGAGRGLCPPPAAWEGDFNPPAPCGAGPFGAASGRSGSDFNPPAPCGAGQRCRPSTRLIMHFNPPAPCGAGQQSCTKFTPCILAQYTIQRAAKLLFAYQQAYFC